MGLNRLNYMFIKMFVSCLSYSVVSPSSDPVIVTREGWHGRPPTSIQHMPNPVPYVVIHHSYIPAACYNLEDCIKAMQWMQDLHQLTNGWVDIGYSFAVGGDGRAYEGRGWSRVGAHAPLYNNRSIGICVIGDWRVDLPPEQQLATVHQLIQKGVREGHIQKDYELVGHKQVREGTECPGDRLYQEIKKWSHYSPEPHEIAPRENHTSIIQVEIHADNRDKEDKDEDNNDSNNDNNRLQKRTLRTS